MTTTPEPTHHDRGDRRDDARREAAWKRWRRTVPARFAAAPTTTIRYPQVEEWVDTLIDQARATPASRVATGPSLLLVGATGTGKTHTAWWAIGRLAHAAVLTAWEVITAADLYAALRPGSGLDSETEFRRVASAPLLVIDDVGALKRSEWTIEVDYRLINHRYNHMLPTLITTNLPARRNEKTPAHVRTLEDVMEDRVLSRLTEMAGGRVVSLGTHDRRRGNR